LWDSSGSKGAVPAAAEQQAVGGKLASHPESRSEIDMSNESEILSRVQGAFKEAFDVDPRSISIDTRPEDVPGWDSVGQLSLASSLEQVFGVNLDVDDLMEMENVREIIRVIGSKLQ
jgi:acyl carrier protein